MRFLIVSFIIIMQKQEVNQELEAFGSSGSQEVENEEVAQKSEGLTKRQIKKIAKKQKWEKEKLIKRQEKRERDKQKKKLKLLEKQQQKQDVGQKQQQIVEKGDHLMKKRKDDYQQKMKEGVKVVIDLQFYELMTEKEQSSLIKQLSYCHSVNRKSQKCFNYILTSATLPRQDVFDKRYNTSKWGINLQQKNLLQVFPKERIIYLTGDAEEEINDFQPDYIYIIGGIVDHNRLKKITYNYAKQNGIAAKRMPMKNVHLKASVHLAVNHVWEWMLKKYNGASWDDALKSVLPQRKLQNYTEE